MILDGIIRGAEITAGVLVLIAVGVWIACLIEDWMHRNASFDS